jgi:PAS domain S-box-containing protein
MSWRRLYEGDRPMFWAGVGVLLFLLTIPIPGSKFIQSSEHYVPLHTALEMFSVVVAFMIFTLVWVGRRDRTASDVVLGCGFLAVGLIDFGHTLSYAGMPVFVTPSGAEKAIAFWLLARFIAAVTLLVVSIGINDDKAPTRSLVSGLLLASLTLSAAAFWIILWHMDWMPRTYISGSGLTAFKIGSELVIVFIMLSASALLWRRYRISGIESLGFLVAAAWVGGIGELFFTVYANVTDLYNLLGHIFKVFAYALIYRGLVVRLVLDPRFRAEQDLRLSEERFKALSEATFGGIVLHDKGLILECNQGLSELSGFDYKELIGMNGLKLIAPESVDTVVANIERDYGESYEAVGLHKDGSRYNLLIRGKNISYQGRTVRVTELHDITGLKKAEVEPNCHR